MNIVELSAAGDKLLSSARGTFASTGMDRRSARLWYGRSGRRSPGSSLGGREVSVVTDLQHKTVSEQVSVEHHRSAREHKTAATTARILYIIGTVAGVLSTVVSAPARDAGNPLAYAAEHSHAVVTGALLVLVMGLSLAFVPVVLFSVLRRVDEVLAVGYLVVRGAVETVCYVLIAIGWLLLVPLGGAMAAGWARRRRQASASAVWSSTLTPRTLCSRSCCALVPACSTCCSIGRASSRAGSQCGVSWRSPSMWPPTCLPCTASSQPTAPGKC